MTAKLMSQDDSSIAGKILPQSKAQFAYEAALTLIKAGLQRMVLDFDHAIKPSILCFEYYEGVIDVAEVEMIAYVHFGGDLKKVLPNNILATETYNSIEDFRNAYMLPRQ